MIINPAMGINERLRIVGTQKEVTQPEDGGLTIEYEADNRASLKAVVNMKNRLDRISSSNAYLKESLDIARTELDTIQQGLIDIDIKNLSVELQGIASQITGLQSTLSDLEQVVDQIPYYVPADSTTDVLLTSALYMKLVGIELATELKDGLMTKEDKQKLDGIDIVDILARLTELEGEI